MQNGTIGVKSKPGKGTTFTFTIPYEDSGVAVKEESMVKPTKKTKLIKFSDSEILVVEDNPFNQGYIDMILKKWDLRYSLAENGKEALEMVKEKEFDAILMDIQMPEMNGYEATEAIRKLKSNPNSEIPIIALTATALVDERKKALNCGMNEHLPKPFTPDQLHHVLVNFLGKKPAKALKKQVDADNDEVMGEIDHDQLETLYGGDQDFMKNMIEMFLNNTPGYLKEMKTFFDQQKWEELYQVAHKSKPTFAMVGLMKLEKVAKEIEGLSKAKKNKNIIVKLEKLIDELSNQYLNLSKELIKLTDKKNP